MPNLAIKSSAMHVLNSIVNDLMENLAVTAGRAVKYNKNLALTAREV